MPHQDPASYRPGTTLPTLSSPAEIEQATEALAQALAATAVERDRAGGHAAAERELIRASGLLDLTTPRAYGGWGQSWETFYASLRRIAQADSSLAHLYAFHHLQVATILLYGKPEQHEFFLRHTVEQRLFWGNALNPNDKRALAIEDGEGWRISGPKSYCSGSVGSDSLTFSAWHEPSQSLLIGALPSDRAGISIRADWDAFGQKQTDSGTVIFDQVRLQAHEVLVRPAEVLADLAAQAIDQALALGDAVTAEERGRVAIAVAEAKAVAHRAAVEVSSQIFELTGASATSSRFGLDRFWRNARVHTLHDPIDYKLRDLGRHALTGAFPEPTSYS